MHTNCLEFFGMGDLSILPFISLLIIYISMDSWFFILYFGYTPILLCLLLYTLAPKSLLGALSVSSYVPLTYFHHCGVSLGFFEPFLAFWHPEFSKFILYIYYYNPQISHYSKISGSFYWRMVLESKV